MPRGGRLLRAKAWQRPLGLDAVDRQGHGVEVGVG